MASSDSPMDKPQRGRPKRTELPDVNINTGAQSINAERGSLKFVQISAEVAKILSKFGRVVPFDYRCLAKHTYQPYYWNLDDQ